MARIHASAVRVYVVTSATPEPGGTHHHVARAAVAGGATAVQLRAPELGDDVLGRVAKDLAVMCREADVLFVVNDRIDVAIAAGADGVHLGQSDGSASAREHLGPEPVLGVSVEDVEQARAAEAAGADYLGITIWPSATKPEARPHGLNGLGVVVRATTLPVVGIGGVDARNAAEVIQAGAAGVAVVSAVAAHPDPVAAVRALRAAVDEATRGDR
jgi:thiamine-phosphate pyrophosphorylase